MKLKLGNEMTLRVSREKKLRLFLVLYIMSLAISIIISKYKTISFIVILIAIGFSVMGVYEFQKSRQEFEEVRE
jgi:hypothetical protein